MTEQILCAFETKISRRIHGPTQDKGRWRPRRNGGIYNLYKDLNIVDDIKTRRLGWAEHIVRMEDERTPKKLLMGNFIVKEMWDNQEQDGRTSSGETHHRS
jgi:hypothetical protein